MQSSALFSEDPVFNYITESPGPDGLDSITEVWQSSQLNLENNNVIIKLGFGEKRI